MYLFIIIGHTGQGKTKFIRNTIKGKKAYVFDVNNEYQDFEIDNRESKYMRNVKLDMKAYVSMCQKIKKTNCIVEDATGFLRGRIGEDFARLLVAKRHSENNYFLLFHSINRVPPEIMEMSNYVILFKTNDNAEIVDKKFKNDNLNRAFAILKNSPKYSYKILQMI